MIRDARANAASPPLRVPLLAQVARIDTLLPRAVQVTQGQRTAVPITVVADSKQDTSVSYEVSSRLARRPACNRWPATPRCRPSKSTSVFLWPGLSLQKTSDGLRSSAGYFCRSMRVRQASFQPSGDFDSVNTR